MDKTLIAARRSGKVIDHPRASSITLQFAGFQQENSNMRRWT
jgi:hypothetical protein